MEVGEEDLKEVGRKRGKVLLEELIYRTPTILFELLETSRIIGRPDKGVALRALIYGSCHL
jgi:hypothetical protein